MVEITAICITIIFFGSWYYLILTMKAWKVKNDNIQRKDKLFFIQGYWPFMRKSLKDGNEELITSGKKLAATMLVTFVITIINFAISEI